MIRLFTIALSFLLSISAFAFNFIGKTFRGTSVLPNGAKATITFVFRSSNRATSTLSVTGKRAETASLLWEESGEYINFYEPSTGDFMAFGVEEDGDGVALIGYDSLGNEAMRLTQVKSTAAKKSGTKKSTTRKK